MKKRFHIMANAMKKELKEHRSSFLVFSILRFLVILVMIRQFSASALFAFIPPRGETARRPLDFIWDTIAPRVST